MLKNKFNFLIMFFILVLLCGFGTAFAQNQLFMSVGPDHLNPKLDSYLSRHSIYADNAFRTWGQCYSPTKGIVGTAGVFDCDINNASENDSYFFQSVDGGYFNTVNKPIKVMDNSFVHWYNNTKSFFLLPAHMGGIPVSNKFPTPQTNGVIVKETASPYADKKPVFPDVKEVFTNLTTTPQNPTTVRLTPGHYTGLVVPDGTNMWLDAGTYYFEGDVTVGRGSKLQVDKSDDSYKTMIYINGGFYIRTEGSFVPQGFDDCVVPEDAAGQIIVMVTDNGSVGWERDQCNEGGSGVGVRTSAILFASNGVTAVGTFIAPYGEIFLQCGAGVYGQLLSNDVYFCFGYNVPGGNPSGCSSNCSSYDFEYLPFETQDVVITAKGETFPEDILWDWKNTGWNKPNACDEPKYTDDIDKKWSETKNRDYDTVINISLSEPLMPGTSLSFKYEITANNGVVGTPLTESTEREARVYLENTTEIIEFSGSTTKQTLKVRVIDFGDNKGDAAFTISFSDLKFSPDDGSIKTSLPPSAKFTILTDDPKGTEISAPEFIDGDRIFEKYAGLGIQNIGELSSSYECSAEFEIVSVFVGNTDVTDLKWIQINENKVETTPAYAADFDIGQEFLKMEFRTIVKIGESEIKSEKSTFKVDINPWNTKAFNVNTYIADCDEKNSVDLFVFDGTVTDTDEPQGLNNQRIGGLTLYSIYDGENPQKNFDYDAADKTLKTPLGATVTIKDDKTLFYDLTDVEISGITDEFWYTAIDTAEYDGYDTDIFVKSVKVVVYINMNVPLPQNAYYFDSNGDGAVDSAVIEFRKEIEDMEVFKNFGIEFNGAQFKSFDKLNNSAIYLLLDNAEQDFTSGDMSIKISYETTDKDGNIIKPEANIVARDRAAPVIVDDAIIVKSLSGGKDTLIVKFSEKMTGFEVVGQKPFRYFKEKKGGTEFENVDYLSISTSDSRTFTIVVSPESSGMGKGVNGGDWIFINSAFGIKDDLGNTQKVYHNKPVEIKQRLRAKLLSAAYFDTDAVSDGYIDMIRFDFGTDISKTFAEQILESMELPNNTSRQFDATGEITLIDNGFEVGVVENKSGSARTFINEFDNISIKTIESGALTIEESSVVPADSIAPVILKAIYRVETDTTLDVIFSEPVNFTGGNPYLFWDVAPDAKQFEMTFKNGNVPTQSADGVVLQYSVASSTNPFPVLGDSIWLMQTGVISDKGLNMQDLTVRAPLELAKPYKEDLILHVAPQPMQVVNVGGKRTQPKELAQGLVDFYSIQGDRYGVAIIIEATGPVSNPKNLRNKGIVKIFDQTGNAVSDELNMVFSHTRGGGIAGSVVWDGKNSVGRSVGAGSYLAIVQVEVAFDDRPNPEVRTYQKIIAVVTGGK